MSSLYSRCTHFSGVPLDEKKYESSKVKFDPFVHKRAHDALRKGVGKGKVVEWRDHSGSGLTIRITATTAVWLIRHRNMTIRIGPVLEFDLAAARYIVDQARVAQQAGRDVKTFVRTLAAIEAKNNLYRDARATETASEAANPETEAGARIISGESFPWTWGDLTNNYLKYKLPRIKESHRHDHERYLRLKPFETIKDVPVPQIGISHLESVRNAILHRHAKSTAFRAVQQGKAMLTWAWKYQATKSGLERVEYEWWKRWSLEYKSKTREHVPLVSELVKTLGIVEAMRGGGDPSRAIAPGTVAALWALVLTGQRIGALVQLERRHLIDDPDRPGWKIAHWTAQQMKGGKEVARPHSLPLPPPVVEAIERGWTEAGEDDGKPSPWAFSSGKSDGHVTSSGIHILLHRLEGRRPQDSRTPKPNRKGKPGPKPKDEAAPKRGLVNHLAANEIEPWTPHDVRRTLAHYLDDIGLGGTASAILSHKRESIYSERAERENVAAVTRTHYAFKAQRLPLKAEGMKAWVDKVLEIYDRVKGDVLVE